MRKEIRKIKFLLDILVRNIFKPEKLKLFLSVWPYTMVGYKRLDNVYELAKRVVQRGIEGDFIECGVWKGGCAGVMGFIAEKEGRGRKTWLFDSFEGLPEPTRDDGDLARFYSDFQFDGNLISINKCVGTIGDVSKTFFQILKLKDENIIIKKGWFQDVLPTEKNKIWKISILRLDGDWYESTKCCLENLYDKITDGGYLIIDDYGHWEGARKAIDEFFEARGIKPEFTKIDYTGVYFKKS